MRGQSSKLDCAEQWLVRGSQDWAAPWLIHTWTTPFSLPCKETPCMNQMSFRKTHLFHSILPAETVATGLMYLWTSHHWISCHAISQPSEILCKLGLWMVGVSGVSDSLGWRRSAKNAKVCLSRENMRPLPALPALLLWSPPLKLKTNSWNSLSSFRTFFINRRTTI